METQLEEANEVAKTSNQKFEDANRKLKVYKKFQPKLTPTLPRFEILYDATLISQNILVLMVFGKNISSSEFRWRT